MKGLKVLCLEAGRMVDPAKDFYTHKYPFEWQFRGEGRPGQYGKLPQGMEWKIKEWTDRLYTVPQEDPYALAPGAKFTWTRLRAVGGRTLLWVRGVDRFGPLDFKSKSLQDGWGEDWPVTYEDVAPYFDSVEALIGVAAGSEEVFNTPTGKNLLPPFRPRCGELLIKRGAEKLGIKVLSKPLAVLSRPYDGRPPCHYCGACGFGCDTRSRYSFLEVLLPKLQTLPNFTLRPNAAVHTVLTDPGAALPGFGSAYKKKIKELYPARVTMGGYGEGLALRSNYLEADPGGLRDRYGIPQVRFHTSAEYDHAFAILNEMYGQIEEILRASGVEILPYKKVAPYPLGSVTHEAGGCRMGDDPRNSVLDKWNRCHDVKNLLVVDASCFVTHPEKQITLTIMALAHRACDHLAEELRLGNV